MAYGTKFMLSVKQYKSALKMAGKMGAGKSEWKSVSRYKQPAPTYRDGKRKKFGVK